jgi:hypothetical protein
MARSRNLLLEAFYSLSRNINKPRTDANENETREGVIGQILPELTLDMTEEELVALSDKWERTWNDSPVKTKWEKAGNENEDYWKGNQFERANVEKTRAMVDNVLFEALETYLPQATRRNPEPMVTLPVGVEQTPEHQEYAHSLQLELAEIADDIKLRLKLKGAARHKETYLLGAVKLSWNIERDAPEVKVTRPQKLILDPEAVTDEDGYSGDRLGEKRKLTASRLVELTANEPNAEELKQFITELAKDGMGTELGFVEWWTPDYMFWKLEGRVLRKRKNPHWNYDEQQAADQPEAVAEENPAVPQGMPALETPQAAPEPAPAALPAGIPAQPEIQPQAAPQAPKAVNHFRTRKLPYVLISTYNLGKQPVDETSLMGQNLAMQDVVNKRNKQIDNNADDMNNGMVVSLARSGLTQQQAKGVTSALRKRGVVAIPDGNPQEAVWKPPTPGLPVDVYNDLNDKRSRIKGVFGVTGLTPSGLAQDSTVRGKIVTKGVDTDRIGGGISDYLEQFSDDIFNWIVQLLYVYDDRFQEAMSKGTPIPRVKVGVKEGSMLPKDSTTLANQAMQLAAAGQMSLIDLYKALDYPNPETMAANAWLQVNAPEVLFEDDPRIQKVIQQKQQEAASAGQVPPKPPSESMNFKDLPPEAQLEMLKQAGINIEPTALLDHLALQHAKELAAKQPPPAAPGAEPAQPALPATE